MRKIFILWCLLPLIISQSQAFCVNSTCNLGCSKKYLWLTGDTVTWNCTLESGCNSWSVTDIIFKRGNSILAENHTEILNNTTKALIIHNSTLEDSRNFYAHLGDREKCWHNEIEMTIRDKPSSPDVYVLYYVNSDVSSTVRVYVSRKNSDRVQGWTVRYSLIPSRPRWYEFLNENCSGYLHMPENNCNISSSVDFPCGCPNMSVNQTSAKCELNGENECFFERKTYNFSVTMTTLYGNYSTVKEVKISKDMAIAPPVKQLNSVNVSGRKAEITWVHWADFKGDVTFRIKYQLKGSKEFIGPSLTTNWQMALSDLKPAKEYSVVVDCHFTNSPNWSSPETLHFSTLEEAPNKSPSLSPGSYTYMSSPCIGCDDTNHTLYLFAKFIPEEDKNGILTEILVTVTGISTNVTQEHHLSPVREMLAITGISPLLSYDIYLRACTKADCSHRPSHIYIPVTSQAPLKPVNIVAEILANGEVNVSWALDTRIVPPYPRHEYNVTVHCCTPSPKLTNVPACLNDYEWHFVSGGEKSYEVAVNNQSSAANPRCGVSLEHNGVSSETAWSDCLYDSQTAPGQVFNPQAVVSGEGVLVSWSPPTCTAFSSYPAFFQITYGLYHNNNNNNTDTCLSRPLQNVEYVDSCQINKEGRLICETTFDELEQRKEYYICIRAISKKGAGQWWQTTGLKIPDQQTGYIIGGVLGALALLLLVVMVSRKVYVKLRGGDVDFKLPPNVPFTKPEENGYGYSCYEKLDTQRAVSSTLESEVSNGDVFSEMAGEEGHPRVTPVRNGNIPNGNGFIPNSNGFIPNGNGFRPVPNSPAEVKDTETTLSNSFPEVIDIELSVGLQPKPEKPVANGLIKSYSVDAETEEGPDLELVDDDEDDDDDPYTGKGKSFSPPNISIRPSVSKEDQKKQLNSKGKQEQKESICANLPSITNYSTYSEDPKENDSKSSTSSEQIELQDLSENSDKNKKSKQNPSKDIIVKDESFIEQDEISIDHKKHGIDLDRHEVDIVR